MPDMNKEALAIWESLKPAIDKEIEKKTAGMVQRRKMKVSTAPSLSTGLIGVKEPFGDEIFIPFVGNLATATVGTPVWVEFSYGANNYIAVGYASLTNKDVTIAGALDIVQRRCSAPLSSIGWYRVLVGQFSSASTANGSRGLVVKFNIVRQGSSQVAESHSITCRTRNNGVSLWSDEDSMANPSSNLLVDKIRHVVDGTNTYFDIHYNANASNNVSVFFDTYMYQLFQYQITSVDFLAVADSPSGTVVSEYSFNKNGTGDINVNGTVTGQGFADLLFGIGNTIASNTDCDSITTEGKYTCPNSTVGGTLTNQPYSSAFGMLVIRIAETTRLAQIAIPNSTTVTLKIRLLGSNGWTAWKTLTPA